MIKYIVLIIIAIFVLAWPFIKRRSRRKTHSDIILEALRNQRERNIAHLQRLARERREREEERIREELERRRNIFRAEHEPSIPAIEFLKKEDFEI
jgi:predicted CopG family antitoxin